MAQSTHGDTILMFDNQRFGPGQMRSCMITLLLLALLPMTVHAAPGYPGAKPPGPKQFLPANNRKSGHQKAITQVKNRFPKSRILSVNLLERGGVSTYRVKTLSQTGVVKYVFVDAATGDVFE